MSNTFCVIPWIFQAVQNNGAIRVCCQMNISNSRGTLLDSEGKVYNASSGNLDEARNAELIKNVRSTMLNGNWHPDCLRCKQEEDSGIRSRRNYENESWNFSYEEAKNVTKNDGSIDVKLTPVKYYDLRFGNLCNLACRMCGPEDSNSWYSDWEMMYGHRWTDTHGEVELTKNSKGEWTTDAYDWHYSEKFWDYMEKNLKNIDMVYMAGGEPLMIKRHYDFLKKCIESGFSKNMTLEYNTNLTILPKKAIEFWKEFKQVRIGASIDGYGEIFEYQRHNAKWDIVQNNLKRIDDMPENVVAWLACTVTNINVYHIPDFMLWKISQNFKKINNNKKNPIITYHVCHKPWYSSIRVLPVDIKQDIENHYLQKLENFKNLDPSLYENAKKILSSIIKYMNAKDESDKLSNFVEYTTNLDKIRSQNILKIIPQYERIFDGN